MQSMQRVLLIVSLLLSTSAWADCMQDINGDVRCGKGMCERDDYGKVYCAKTENGGAMRNNDGYVVCGLGECYQTLDGDVLCSTENNGGAAINIDGEVKCAGGCIKATTQQCDSTLAQ